MAQGAISDLRRSESVIVDAVGAASKLARPGPTPQSPKVPLKIGDTLELNDNRAVVVGICNVSRTFQSQPVIYTTYSRAITFAPRERKLLAFVIVKARDGVDPQQLCDRISQSTGLAAYTRNQFKWLTVSYFLKYTGIPINFGIAVMLGFLVGTVIAGQTFYNFTLDNLKHFGALKAMGASNLTLTRMVVTQALIVGLVGYGLGVGAASLFGALTAKSELAFWMPWQLLVISAAAVIIICALSAVISLWKVVRLEPAIVFK
jgi:putative ABC transport system permease protein